MDDESEYRVKVSIRNNLILEAIEALGYTSIQRFCEDNKLSAHGVRAMINFQKRPINQEGSFCALAQELMEVLGAAPTDLWTVEQLNLCLPKNSAERVLGQKQLDALLCMDNGELVALATPDEELSKQEFKDLMEDKLSTLTPREKYVLTTHYGLGCDPRTLDEIGRDYDVCRGRISQIEKKALRKMRHPSRAKDLYEGFFGVDYPHDKRVEK